MRRERLEANESKLEGGERSDLALPTPVSSLYMVSIIEKFGESRVTGRWVE